MAHFDRYLKGLPSQKVTELRRTWPAPVTFLIPDNGFCPDWIKGSHRTVAIRVSAHSVVQSLCNLVDGPLVSTSANRSGCAPALTEEAVRRLFAGEIDLIVPGALSGPEGASEIRDLLSGQVLRQGTVL
jgi:L-threonylcarbamoyladenylate synthase